MMATLAHGTAERLSFVFLLGASIWIYLDPLVEISERNVHVSDVLLVIAAAVLLVPGAATGIRAAFLGHRLLHPFLLFGAAALASLAVTGIGRNLPVAPERTAVGVVQLGFVILLLYPLLLVHTARPGRYRALLWLHAAMIALAGAVSIVEYGWWTRDLYPRHLNPLLGTNGFWLFALVSPFLMHEVVRGFFTADRLVAGAAALLLWTLGCAGVVLAGGRAGAALVALSFVWVAASYAGRVRWTGGVPATLLSRSCAAPAGALGLLALIALTLAVTFPVLQTRVVTESRRAEQGRAIAPGTEAAGQRPHVHLLIGLDTLGAAVDESGAIIMSRQDLIQAGLDGFRSSPVALGHGLGQFQVLNPAAPITIHNVYVQLLYETGLIGLGAYLWLLAVLLHAVQRYPRVPTDAMHPPSDLRIRREGAYFALAIILLVGWVYPLGHARSDWIVFFVCVSMAPVSMVPHRRDAVTVRRSVETGAGM